MPDTSEMVGGDAPAQAAGTDAPKRFNPNDRLLKAIREGDVLLQAGDEEKFRALGLSDKDLDRLRKDGAISGFHGAKRVELDDDPTVIVSAARQRTEDPDHAAMRLNHVHGEELGDDFFGDDAPTRP